MMNIYESKNYRLLILIPVALLIVSLFLVPHIHLDSTLTGGTNVQITTNTTISIDTLSKSLDAVFPSATVQRYSSSLSITIPPNASLTSALERVNLLDSYYSNYSKAVLNAAIYRNMLMNASYINNQSTKNSLASEQANATKYLGLMGTTLDQEISDLHPLLSSVPSYNSSDAGSMQTVAGNIYSNASYSYKTIVLSKIKKIVPFTSYSYNEVAPQVGGFFLQEIRNIIIIAFILVAITVFIIFRSVVPSFAVIFGAANDIIVALGAMAVFGIPLGVASVGGLLMLLGYSIDTDMLVAVRILKRTEGTPSTRAMETLKTGVTMTSAAIISFLTLFIVAYIVFIPTYLEIAGVALFGLVADIATTWFANTVLVVWYKNKKEIK